MISPCKLALALILCPAEAAAAAHSLPRVPLVISFIYLRVYECVCVCCLFTTSKLLSFDGGRVREEVHLKEEEKTERARGGGECSDQGKRFISCHLLLQAGLKHSCQTGHFLVTLWKPLPFQPCDSLFDASNRSPSACSQLVMIPRLRADISPDLGTWERTTSADAT